MKDYSIFKDFLQFNQTYLDFIIVASSGLNYLSHLTNDENLRSIYSTLNYSIEHLQRKFYTAKSFQKNNSSDVIDFFDSSQIYLEILITCYEALNYHFNLSGNPHIRSISITINFAIEQLMKAYDNFSHIKNKSNKGGNENG